MEASCWVARKIFLSAANASSKARTLDSRPTTNGVIMKGKMTTSRMGIMGSFLVSNFSLAVVTLSPEFLKLRPYEYSPRPRSTLPRLPGLLHHGQRSTAFLHHLPRYLELFQFLLTWPL